jgi:hypothetical protein
VIATLCRHSYRGVNIYLTVQQRELLRLIESRVLHGMPAVQRDYAEALGIRRDSLNKLLARTRRVLARHGVELVMPPRRGQAAAPLGSLAGLDDW